MFRLEDCSMVWPSGRGVHSVSLELEKGSITAVCGRNGAGKTTLLDLFNGRQKPTGGSVVLDCSQAQVGFLPTIDFLEPELTAKENLAFLSYLKAGSTKAWEWQKSDSLLGIKLIEVLEVEHLLGSQLNALSSGERRKIHILASLIGERPDSLPQLLIWDEPNNNLDIVANLHIVSILNRVRDAGATILIATHVAETLTTLQGQCVVLKDGAKVDVLSMDRSDFLDHLKRWLL